MLSTWGTEIKKLKAPKRNHVLQTAYENNNYPHDQKVRADSNALHMIIILVSYYYNNPYHT